MSNEVAILLNEIQFRTGFTLEQIDEKVGYSRPYLNNVKIKGGGEKLLAKLKHEYAEILQNVPRNTPIADKAKAYDALFSVLIADYAAWKGQQTGENPEVIARKLYKAAEDVQRLSG